MARCGSRRRDGSKRQEGAEGFRRTLQTATIDALTGRGLWGSQQEPWICLRGGLEQNIDVSQNIAASSTIDGFSFGEQSTGVSDDVCERSKDEGWEHRYRAVCEIIKSTPRCLTCEADVVNRRHQSKELAGLVKSSNVNLASQVFDFLLG